MTEARKMTNADDLGRAMAQALHARVDTLDPSVEERLRAARQAALQAAAESAKAPELVLQTSLAGAGSAGRQRGRWSWLIPASILLVGMTAIAHSQWLQQTLGLADRDAAVLKDNLPPNAYGDPGFNEYLDEKPQTETPPPDEDEAQP
jgi:Protein of unknown function (DUF3619)